jgi:hypothetical protein
MRRRRHIAPAGAVDHQSAETRHQKREERDVAPLAGETQTCPVIAISETMAMFVGLKRCLAAELE